MDDQERRMWQQRVNDLQQMVKLLMTSTAIALLFFLASLARGFM